MVKFNLLQTYLNNKKDDVRDITDVDTAHMNPRYVPLLCHKKILYDTTLHITKINDNTNNTHTLPSSELSIEPIDVTGPPRSSVANHLRGCSYSRPPRSSDSSLETDVSDSYEYDNCSGDDCTDEFFYDDEFTPGCHDDGDQASTGVLAISDEGFEGHQLAVPCLSNGKGVDDIIFPELQVVSHMQSSVYSHTSNNDCSSLCRPIVSSSNQNNNKRVSNGNNTRPSSGSSVDITEYQLNDLDSERRPSRQSIESRVPLKLIEDCCLVKDELTVRADVVFRYHGNGDGDDLVLRSTQSPKRCHAEFSANNVGVGTWRDNDQSKNRINIIDKGEPVTSGKNVVSTRDKRNGDDGDNGLCGIGLTTWSKLGTGGVGVVGGVAGKKSAFTAWNSPKNQKSAESSASESLRREDGQASLQSTSQYVKESFVDTVPGMSPSPSKSRLLIDRFKTYHEPLSDVSIADRELNLSLGPVWSQTPSHVTDSVSANPVSYEQFIRTGHVTQSKARPLFQDAFVACQSAATYLNDGCCENNRPTNHVDDDARVVDDRQPVPDCHGYDYDTSSTIYNLFPPNITIDNGDYRLLDSGCCSGKISSRTTGSETWSSSLSSSSSISAVSSVQSCHSYVMSPWRRLPDLDFIEERLMQPITGGNDSTTSSSCSSCSDGYKQRLDKIQHTMSSSQAPNAENPSNDEIRKICSPGVTTLDENSKDAQQVQVQSLRKVGQRLPHYTNECTAVPPGERRYILRTSPISEQRDDVILAGRCLGEISKSAKVQRPDSLNTVSSYCRVGIIDKNESSRPLFVDDFRRHGDERCLKQSSCSSTTTSEQHGQHDDVIRSSAATRRHVTWFDCCGTSHKNGLNTGGQRLNRSNDVEDSAMTSSATSSSSMYKTINELDNTVTSYDGFRYLVDDENKSIGTATFITNSVNSQHPTIQLSSGYIAHKNELITDVEKAVGLLVRHCDRTSTSSRTGHPDAQTLVSNNVLLIRLVVHWLCPAIHAIILDGLKPYVYCLFGRVKNSAWNVVEESVRQGPHVIFSSVIANVKSCTDLNTCWLLFNAFIVALINEKSLDIWFLHLFTHRRQLKLHYESRSLFSSDDALSSSDRQLFVRLLAALKPMSYLPPICLELNCELALRRSDRIIDDRCGESPKSTPTPTTCKYSSLNLARGVMSKWLKGTTIGNRGVRVVDRLVRGVASTASHAVAVADQVVKVVMSSADRDLDNNSSFRQSQLSRLVDDNPAAAASLSTEHKSPSAVHTGHQAVDDVDSIMMSQPGYENNMSRESTSGGQGLTRSSAGKDKTSVSTEPGTSVSACLVLHLSGACLAFNKAAFLTDCCLRCTFLGSATLFLHIAYISTNMLTKLSLLRRSVQTTNRRSKL